ncbi:15781_t:CDS:1 [Acaulospora morrowiae]|uniref:15781_t:CDS:1 n=1 Tax=Acaulospora morrowiae TaxID=94023 RepID=A0A9N9IX04_9GLOM|nr:15781_t:CDS:1 [Acaulospora morrowiae]
MLNITLQTLETIQYLWAQTNLYFLDLNINQTMDVIYTNLNALTSSSDFVVLFVFFALLYVLFSIARMIFRWVYGTVVGMVKFGFYVFIAIVLYWIYVSIDVEKGNEELMMTKQKLVQGVKGVVRDAIHNDL